MITSKRVMIGAVLAAAAAWLSVPAPVSAQEEADPNAPVVERIDIANNQFLQKETFLFYISTKVGDRYDERRLKEDFRRLWDTGFVDDLFIDVRDSPTGSKIVTFRVNERKRIQIVDYRGIKALTTTSIDDELKKREAGLKIDTFYDLGKARRVETIIKEMLAEKGRPFGTVRHEAKPIGGAGLQVSFVVDEGPKAKVKEIDFVGNEVFSDGKLRGKMKKVKQKGFWNLTWLLGKTTYTLDKWSGPEGDQKRVEDFYLNNGFVTATVGSPKVSYIEGKPGKKPTKGIRLEIPVSEGDQYRIGEVKFEGMTVFKPELVLPIFKLETGEVYKESKIKKGFDKLRDAYGSQGYFQWTGRPERKPDPKRKVVDVTLTMDEDKKYYVGKIVFTGNTTTRDKVIRREVFLNEGDIFNTEALKLSIRRINQLGYFKPMEGVPELGPSTLGEDRIDVTFKVEEQNRNQFTFGGGVSGLEGTFVNASFSTANFLGQGETFQISAQSGRRTKNYQIAVTEPYLFDRPITAGFDIFKRKLIYETFTSVAGYTDDRAGASLTVGLPLGRRGFNRIFANYSYQLIKIEGLNDLLGIDPDNPNPDEPVFDPFFFGEEGRRRESTFFPPWCTTPWTTPTPRAAAEVHLHPGDRGWPAGRNRQLLPARPRVHLVHPAPQEDGAGPARAGVLHPRLRRHAGPPLLPALLPRGRDPDPRREHPHRGPDRGGPGPGREQVRALQRRVLLRRRRPPAAAVVLRCRPGLPRRSEHRPQAAPDVDRSRAAVHHARPQRAFPAHLRLESQPGSVPAEVDLQVRRRHHVLRRE